MFSKGRCVDVGLKLAVVPAVRVAKSVAKEFIARLGCCCEGVCIDRRVSLSCVQLSDYVNIAHDAELSNVTLGKRTSVGRYTKIRDAEIGPYCSISWDVTIGAVGHPLDRPTAHAFTYRNQFGIVNKNDSFGAEVVLIGHDVWIGCNVVIMPGLSIGDGAVIGAGSVVTKDIPSYTVVAGNPARVLRKRFDEGLSESLDRTHWWEWSDKELKQNIGFLTTPLSEDSLRRLELKEE